MISFAKNLNRVPRLCTSKNEIYLKINSTLSAANYTRRFQSQQFKDESKKLATASFEENYKIFMDAYPKVLKNFQEIEGVSLIKDRLTECLNYNVIHGKKMRGLFILTVYKLLVDEKLLTEENIYKVALMGWLNEVIQGAFLIMDDITDMAEMRRGQVVWHKKPEIGNVGLADAFLLYHAVFKLFTDKFGHKKNFVKMMSSFNRDYFDTVLGQLMDCETVPMDQFTMDRYGVISTYKTTIYSIYLPWSLALNLAEIDDPALEEISKQIIYLVGYGNQALDDLLDVYGTGESGKLCTDIQNGKANWIISKALMLANQEQKKVLLMNYGKNDAKCVENVRKVFDELGMKELLIKELDDMLMKVNELCGRCPNKKIGAFFSKLAAKTMSRNC